MAKKKRAADKKGPGNWPYYELGGIAIGVSPHPEAADHYALFVVVGDTGYAVAAYADEADAREAAEVLEEAMADAAEGHTHGPDCDHDHEDFEIELEDDAPAKSAKKSGKKAAKAKGKAKPAAKPAAKAAKKPAKKAAAKKSGSKSRK